MSGELTAVTGGVFFAWVRIFSVTRKRVRVRKIPEVLRPKAAGVSERKFAAVVGCVRSTVRLCLNRAAAAGIVWALSDELNGWALVGAGLEADAPSQVSRPEPANARKLTC